MDFDVMLFPASIGILIEDAISKFGAHYDFFSCLTNRVLAKNMCVGGKISGEKDLVNLYKLAMSRIEQSGTHVSKWKGSFAGYFMLFRKRLWDEIPFPNIGLANKKACRVLGIDTEWHRRLIKAEKRIGCLDGVTAVHYYRLAEDHAEHRAMLENPEGIPEPDISATIPAPNPVVQTRPKKHNDRNRRGRMSAAQK